MTTNGKKKPEAPPIVLILTLQPDGVGTLLTKRGDLASLSSFTYRDMKEIVAAMERSAAHLIEVEQNPPPKELPKFVASSSTSVSTAAPATTAVNDNPPEAETTSADEAIQQEEPPLETLDAPQPEASSPTAQLSLF